MANVKRSFLVGLIVLRGVAGASGQSTNHIPIADLRQLRLPDVALESVAPVAASVQGNFHSAAHVKVDGVIGGNIHFALLLPDSWNGRFVMGGGGGFVGTVQNGAWESVNRGYATVGTDTGHQEPSGISARWALNDVEAQLNFGYLAVHRTAEAAKAIVRSYYGSDAAYNYFTGCSRGGGQAMMEAQRYPKDFDGLVAGAPAFDWTGMAAAAASVAKVIYPDPAHVDKTVLDRASLQKLQQAILEQCDAQDGLKDGIVQDPPSMHFDLSKISGLTDEQRKAIRAIYTGAQNGQGLIYPGYTPGAECDPDQWIAWITGSSTSQDRQHAPGLMFVLGTEIFKYLVFNNPDWNYATYDLSNYAGDTRLAASFLDATNANLDGLKARKGKLIIWHGWADPALPAQATVNYYRQAQAHDPNVSDYCRLFMVPGCFHCGGGPGASEVDWLAVMTDWVEHGKAPDRLVAGKTEQGKMRMTRPLFRYPTTAIYKGGNPDSADSFAAKEPSPAPRQKTH